MKKTELFAMREAYAQGWNDAIKSVEDSMETIDIFNKSPETNLVYSIRDYVVKVTNEIRGQ